MLRDTVLTEVQRPPVYLTSLLDHEGMERFLCNVEDLVGAEPGLVDTSCGRVYDVTPRDLDVQPDLVAFTRDDHAGAVVRMDRAFTSDIRKVRVGNHVHDAPDIIWNVVMSAVNPSHTTWEPGTCLLSIQCNPHGLTDP